MGRKTCCEKRDDHLTARRPGRISHQLSEQLSLEAFSEVWGDEMGSSLQNHWHQKKKRFGIGVACRATLRETAFAISQFQAGGGEMTYSL